MKQKFANILKYHRVVYGLYYYLMSFVINIMKLLIRTDDKLILFNSYAGRKFDDSPKAVFEAMKKDSRFRDYRLVWAFHQPERFMVEGGGKIKTDGLGYFIAALKARVWITNSSVERGLHFKGKNTLYLNTWHGSPIKKMGTDIVSGNQSFKTISKNVIDIMNTQSNFEAEIFSRCFNIPRKHFIEVGLPRNDELVNYSEKDRNEIRSKLNIPDDKLVILYCPTFREYEKDENLGVVFAPPMDLKKWERELGNNYILLFRSHYEVSKVMKFKEDLFIRNVTDYASLNNLMIASDVLISDYSSIFFDYSIMDKCMLHFTYDFNKYEEKRGLYFDIRKYLSGSESENGVIKILTNLNYYNEVNKTILFRNNFLNFYGNAAHETIECIAKQIM